MDILEIKNVLYGYSSSNEGVLSLINRGFEQGGFYTIIGKSGIGKSTLLSLLAELDSPGTGQILFKNKNIEEKGHNYHRKNSTSLIFQNYNLIDYLTPLENIRLVNKNTSEDILLELGLDKSQTRRDVMKLSGGQQQRVVIARALASETPIILVDEPTGSLGGITANEIIAILKKLTLERNKCVIVVTHSKEATKTAGIVLELKDRKLQKVVDNI